MAYPEPRYHRQETVKRIYKSIYIRITPMNLLSNKRMVCWVTFLQTNIATTGSDNLVGTHDNHRSADTLVVQYIITEYQQYG
jgi:hypothetical protein